MIQVQDLVKDFKLTRKIRKEMGAEFKNKKSLRAVDKISFTCQPGRIFALVGPNGVGKTTILRMIATMLKPTSGTNEVGGYDCQKNPQTVREKIGFMTDQTALYDRLTPYEMVKYIADLHGMDASVFKSRKDKIFDMLNIHEFANRRIARLSSGMKQKTSIARTIIHDPDVLVFDEPTTGLDVMTSRAIIKLIRSCKEKGKTVIFSSHRMGEVEQISDDIAIIYKGSLYFNGGLDQFKSEMTHETFEDEFIHMVGEV